MQKAEDAIKAGDAKGAKKAIKDSYMKGKVKRKVKRVAGQEARKTKRASNKTDRINNKIDKLEDKKPENKAMASDKPNERKKLRKAKKLVKEKKISSNQLVDINNFQKKIIQLRGNKFIIDDNSCSIFYEDIIKSKFKITKRNDPTYLLKAIKNKTEIKNMINAHIYDGVALTKFLYWIKKVNKKKINEVQAQNKLESFRKLNKDYLYPSFDTIAGSGKMEQQFTIEQRKMAVGL